MAMSDMYIMEEDMSIELDVEVVVGMDMDMVEVAVAVVISDMSIMVTSNQESWNLNLEARSCGYRKAESLYKALRRP